MANRIMNVIRSLAPRFTKTTAKRFSKTALIVVSLAFVTACAKAPKGGMENDGKWSPESTFPDQPGYGYGTSSPAYSKPTYRPKPEQPITAKPTGPSAVAPDQDTDLGVSDRPTPQEQRPAATPSDDNEEINPDDYLPPQGPQQPPNTDQQPEQPPTVPQPKKPKAPKPKPGTSQTTQNSDVDTDPTGQNQPPAPGTPAPKPNKPSDKPSDKPANKPPATPTPKPSAPAPSKPVAVTGFWDSSGKSGNNWTRLTVQALAAHGRTLVRTVPADVTYFCPKYASLKLDGKISFWVHFISAIALKESSFNPESKYEESFTDSTGANVVSRGLLQISFESAKYYDCPVTTPTDLHDPNKNIICGVRILNKWVPNDGYLRGRRGPMNMGAARYWSVVRKGPKLASIRNAMNSLAFCKSDAKTESKSSGN